MNNRKASRSTLFLMELVMVVFLFACCAAVCLGLFGTAQKMTDDSDSLNHAVAISRTAASCYKAADGDLREMLVLMAVPGTLDTNSVTVYYDKHWMPIEYSAEDGFCLQVVSVSENADTLRKADIIISHTDREPVFQIQVKKAQTKKAAADTGGELYAAQ